ncbi:HAD-IA family hydrolase [Thalassotalea mangrovi]|uniref:HAD family hydrolase n=1 Tax=Thalassotalea mangrovi TaxID=2572245 RepID=A0A4U1B679_9GAMM|nr:HAD-IA family hydrolase [Thalassotalea mangrovi]TKB45918.1 HAD family hydrolase [Thalassotalea mangrovi]
MKHWHNKGILFDLDGTLVDTAVDLHAVLNQLLADHGRPKVSLEKITPIGSDGIYPLLDLGFEQALNQADKECLRAEFIAIYQQHPTRFSQLFDGIEDILTTLNAHQVPWGIVTNKPTSLTLPLLEKFAVLTHSNVLVCGDTLAFRKPHPAPMHHAQQALAIGDSGNILYVGDARRDIDAGNAAKMHTAIASWGYISKDNDVTDWGARYIISHPRELLELTI